MRRTAILTLTVLLSLTGYSGAQELPDYRFMIENMRTINSRFSELAIMPLDDSTYLLVSDRGAKDKYNNWIGGTPYDLFLVNRLDWYDIRPAGDGLNTKFSDGPVTVAGPGEWYITQTNNRGQNDPKTGAFIYRLNITRAVWSDGRWKLEELPYFKSKEYSFAHPAVSPDGRMLFLSSDLPGGYGGKDLYVCYRTADAWTAPENLGPLVNSPRDETFPFYHASGRLYFSSNRKGGFGGYDIWQSDKVEGGWTTASVLSEPVNSASNEYAIWFDSGMERGYFSSNRLGGRGGDDVYAIFVDRIGAAEAGPAQSGPADREAVKEPAAGPEAVAPATARAAMPREMSSLDSAMHVGDLKNVYFGSGSAALDEEARTLLNTLTGLLATYDDPVLELHAHADATGNYEENIALSERRARSVMQYLISKGVDMSRLSYKPYGESQLAVSEGAAQRLNRRVEFRLMQYNYQDAAANPSAGEVYVKRLPMLEPGGYYVQLLALGASSIFPGYKLRKYGAAVCYFERGLYKYVLGPFKGEQEARGVLESVKGDYRDAFLFRNY